MNRCAKLFIWWCRRQWQRDAKAEESGKLFKKRIDWRTVACWILRQLFIIFSRRLSLITRFAVERVFVSISCQFLQFDSTFDYKRVRDSYENELSGWWIFQTFQLRQQVTNTIISRSFPIITTSMLLCKSIRVASQIELLSVSLVWQTKIYASNFECLVMHDKSSINLHALLNLFFAQHRSTFMRNQLIRRKLLPRWVHLTSTSCSFVNKRTRRGRIIRKKISSFCHSIFLSSAPIFSLRQFVIKIFQFFLLHGSVLSSFVIINCACEAEK